MLKESIISPHARTLIATQSGKMERHQNFLNWLKNVIQILRAFLAPLMLTYCWATCNIRTANPRKEELYWIGRRIQILVLITVPSLLSHLVAIPNEVWPIRSCVRRSIELLAERQVQKMLTSLKQIVLILLDANSVQTPARMISLVIRPSVWILWVRRLIERIPLTCLAFRCASLLQKCGPAWGICWHRMKALCCFAMTTDEVQQPPYYLVIERPKRIYWFRKPQMMNRFMWIVSEKIFLKLWHLTKKMGYQWIISSAWQDFTYNATNREQVIVLHVSRIAHRYNLANYQYHYWMKFWNCASRCSISYHVYKKFRENANVMPTALLAVINVYDTISEQL